MNIEVIVIVVAFKGLGPLKSIAASGGGDTLGVLLSSAGFSCSNWLAMLEKKDENKGLAYAQNLADLQAMEKDIDRDGRSGKIS